MKQKIVVDHLRSEVDRQKMVDVGRGAEKILGIRQSQLQSALDILQQEGYRVYVGQVKSLAGKKTAIKLLVTADTTEEAIRSRNTSFQESWAKHKFGQVHPINEKA